MPSLFDHQSNSYVKLLIVGDTKSGKTGSLVSLVKAGYWLGILDMDNLLDVLKFQILEQCPDKISNVEFRTLRDKRKMTPQGPIIDGRPTAFIDAIRMLDNWTYDDVDYGKPCEWGPERILVIDSWSRMCDAAFDWRETLTPRGRSGEYDKRATYGDAQDVVENVLATLTSSNFETNVIVISHSQYMDMPNGVKKIFPQGVGQKLSPKIPQYFPGYVRYTNKGGKRTIQTESDVTIDLATPRPGVIAESYPIETGLAQIFEALRGPVVKAKPKTLTLRKV